VFKLPLCLPSHNRDLRGGVGDTFSPILNFDRHGDYLITGTTLPLPFLISAPERCEWSASVSSTHWTGGWVSSRTVQDAVEKRKIPIIAPAGKRTLLV